MLVLVPFNAVDKRRFDANPVIKIIVGTVGNNQLSPLLHFVVQLPEHLHVNGILLLVFAKPDAGIFVQVID